LSDVFHFVLEFVLTKRLESAKSFAAVYYISITRVSIFRRSVELDSECLMLIGEEEDFRGVEGSADV
jgi:hypothetical protein